VKAFFETANPEDEFLLVEFSDTPRLAVPLTKDPRQIETRLTSSKSGSEQEFDGAPILCRLFDLLKFNEFGIGDGHAFGFQQQVADVLIAATTIDEHPNISVERLDHAEANLSSAIVQDPLQMLHQHLREFLERPQPLPLQLVHPALQVVEHRAFVAVVPELLQALFEKVGFEHAPVQLEQPVEFSALRNSQVLPPAHQ